MTTDPIDERLSRLEAAVTRSAPTAEQIAQQVLVILSQSRPPAESPSGLVPQFVPVAEPPPGASAAPPDDHVRHWLFRGVLTELRLIPRMYFDPRYRLSRVAQVGVPAILALLVVNYLFFNYSLGFIPALPQILERIIILVLGVVLYKLLTREAARYRSVLDYLKQYR